MIKPIDRVVRVVFAVTYLSCVYCCSWAVFRFTRHFAEDKRDRDTIVKSFTQCPTNDDSKTQFPEYYHACATLCGRLYKEKLECVSSINGGSVTCVCEQHYTTK